MKRVEDTPLPFYSVGYSLDFIFLVWLYYWGIIIIDDKLHNFVGKCFFSVHQKHEKDTFSLSTGAVAMEKKGFANNMNLTDSNSHWKNWLDRISTKQGKMLQPIKLIFWEKGPKS